MNTPYFVNILFYFFVILIAIVVPAAFTFWNLWNLFAKRKWKPGAALVGTLVIGYVDYMILFFLDWQTAGDYNEVINTAQIHYTIASAHLLSVALPALLGVAGLLVIGLCPVRKTPPLVAAISVALVVIGNVVNIFYAIQIWKNVELPFDLLFYVFHFNLLLLSIQHIHHQITEQVKVMKERNTVFRYKWVAKLYLFLSKISHMRLFCFSMIFLVAAVLEIILILFGQGVDGVVKAFTMTADWTFSTQTPPPPVEYSGHYLCTVAAGGHKRIVKPLRYGTRLGTTIVVNRQLCIANAFEELIHDRAPAFHKWVRHFYDTHGYPVSRLITNSWRADVVYILMKPLEWIFLLALYLFDANPEKRIARQYQWKGL
jgi:hypothetical protein